MKHTYFVNEANKKVVANYAIPFNKTVTGEIFRKCCKNTASFVGYFVRIYGLDVHKKFTGTAVCKNDGDFNVDYGKGLAMQKAQYKYHKSMVKKYRKILDMIRVALNEIEELAFHHQTKVMNIEKDYNTYYLGKE